MMHLISTGAESLAFLDQDGQTLLERVALLPFAVHYLRGGAIDEARISKAPTRSYQQALQTDEFRLGSFSHPRHIHDARKREKDLRSRAKHGVRPGLADRDEVCHFQG